MIRDLAKKPAYLPQSHHYTGLVTRLVTHSASHHLTNHGSTLIANTAASIFSKKNIRKKKSPHISDDFFCTWYVDYAAPCSFLTVS